MPWKPFMEDKREDHLGLLSSGGRCAAARSVSDSSSKCIPVLRAASSLGDGGFKAICDVLAPPSPWSASPPLSLNKALIYHSFKTFMPFYMAKEFHFALDNCI